MNGSPSPVPPYWTPERVRLHNWLSKEAPPLADLYHGALIMVQDRAFPGRLRLVCHAVRELANRLAGYLLGYEDSGRVQYEQRLTQIYELSVAAGYDIEQSKAGDGPEPGETRAIPAVVAQAFDQLVVEHVAGAKRPNDRALQLFRAAAPDNQTASAELFPAVGNWRRVVRWFVERAHERGPRSGESSGEDELDGHFQQFETVLRTLSEGFFATVGEIDEILDAANR